MSPTARSLKHLRAAGWEADVVEKWIPGANIRKDLFGCIDILAIRGRETLGVQATSGSNVASRVSKITDSPMLPKIREAGWGLQVHGWSKRANGRWALREVDIS